MTPLQTGKKTAAYLLDLPLKTVVSESNKLAKTVAWIAIGIFSLLSLGLYAHKTYKFFADRNVSKPGLEISKKEDRSFDLGLEDAVKAGDVDKFRQLQKQAAKSPSNATLSTLISLAVAHGRLEMVKELKEKGADLNQKHQGQTPLERSLKNPLPGVPREDLDKVTHYLLSFDEVTVTYQMMADYFPQPYAIVDLAIKLAAKTEKIDSKNYPNSLVRVAADFFYEKDKEKGRRLLELLVRKGDRLVNVEPKPVSYEARRIIDEAIPTCDRIAIGPLS